MQVNTETPAPDQTTQAVATHHAKTRCSWRRYCGKSVVVRVLAETIMITYVDGCLGESRAWEALTLAHVDLLACNWISYTLVQLDGTSTEHNGWLHTDNDHASSPAADKRLAAALRSAADAHPVSRELDWSCYDTSVEYAERGLRMGCLTAPTRARPSALEISNAQR